jgi:hypothetical protein
MQQKLKLFFLITCFDCIWSSTGENTYMLLLKHVHMFLRQHAMLHKSAKKTLSKMNWSDPRHSLQM